MLQISVQVGRACIGVLLEGNAIETGLQYLTQKVYNYSEKLEVCSL